MILLLITLHLVRVALGGWCQSGYPLRYEERESVASSLSFAQGFREFWAGVVEIATDEQDDAPVAGIDLADLNNKVDDGKIRDLYELFVGSDPRFIAILLSERRVLDQLFRKANLQEYVEKLEDIVSTKFATIIDLYWKDSLTWSEKMGVQLLSGEEEERDSKYFYIFKLLSSLPGARTAGISFYCSSGAVKEVRKKLESLIRTIHYMFQIVKLDQLFDIDGAILDENNGINIEFLPTKPRYLFKKVLEGYVKNIGTEISGRVVGGVLRMDIRKSYSDKEVLLAALNRFGPGLVKLFQMFGNQAKSDELKVFLDALKDRVEPMSDEDRNIVIERTFQGFDRFVEGSFLTFAARYADGTDRFNSESRPVKLIKLIRRVGSASIAEGWLALVQFEGEKPREVFLKIKRFKVERRLAREVQFLREMIETEVTLAETVNELQEDLSSELDFEREFANQWEGYNIYNGRLKRSVFVPEPYAVVLNPEGNEAIIIMANERGESLKKALESDLTVEQARALIEFQTKFMGKWFAQLYIHGHVYADPHPGNILVDFHRVPEFSSFVLLDWGYVIHMEQDKLDIFRGYMQGLLTRSSNLIISAFGGDLKDERWMNLKLSFDEIFQEMKQVEMHRLLRQWSPKTELFTGLFRKSSMAETTQTVQNDRSFINRLLRSSRSMSFPSSEGTDSEVRDESLMDEEEPGDLFVDALEEFEAPAEVDTFSIRSESVKERLINMKDFYKGDRLLYLGDQIINEVINSDEVPIPKGIVGVFRAKQFMEQTLEIIRNHPTVIASKLQVPRPFTAYILGLITHGKSSEKALGSALLNVIRGLVN